MEQIIIKKAKASDEQGYSQTNAFGNKEVIGGHVTVSTNEEAKSKNDGDRLAYTRVVRPSQLPEAIEGSSQQVADFNGVTVEVVDSSTAVDSNSKYAIRLTEAFRAFLDQQLQPVTPEESLETITSPIGTIFSGLYNLSSELEITNFIKSQRCIPIALDPLFDNPFKVYISRISPITNDVNQNEILVEFGTINKEEIYVSGPSIESFYKHMVSLYKRFAELEDCDKFYGEYLGICL